MTSLNLSTNGPSISNSYNKIVNAPAPTGPAANSSTYGQWAVYTVQAPLVSAFQSESGKESVLKVQTTGEGELVDLIEEFSDGRIQFAFLKVKDSNSGLPKNVLIGWCGEGVPERTKGYFTSHLNAVSKLLHGYHVQVTARSDRDLTPDTIVQKVADASGSKYTGGGAAPASSGPRPPVASKPSMPTKSFGGTSAYQPLPGLSRGAAPPSRTDGDGWGEDAPEVSRSQLEKVGSAYQPTKVDIAALQSQREPSRYQAPQKQDSNNPDLVRGGYQPIGKVDIAAIRAQARDPRDERPTVVKGAYEPIGKVDIADIRRKAQGGPAPSQPLPPQSSGNGDDEQPKSLADRSAAFTESERLTSMPKPKVANRFGSSTSNFAGTKAPTPSGFGAKPLAGAAPVGTASKTFADEGGKTPAQIWAEKKARERGTSIGTDDRPSSGTPASPIASQPSGGWQSGYGGKKWGVQIPSRTGGSGVSEQKTGNQDEEPQQEENDRPSNGTAAMRDRFSQATPQQPEPPALNTSTKPSASRGVPMPGLPQRPSTNDVPQEQHQDLPAPPPRPIPADEPEGEEEDIPQGSGSPVPLARPVARGPSPPPLDRAASIEPTLSRSPPPMPTDSIAEAASRMQISEPEIPAADPGRKAAQAAAASTFGAAATAPAPQSGAGKEAIAQYDYEKAEDNELELHDGERITNIEMVDEDWWMGENERGEKGLFPSNYVELVEGGARDEGAPQQEEAEEAAPPAKVIGGAGGAAKGNPTATAQYDYEAAEDNELSFPDGAKITDVEFPDEDWWSGSYGGKQGLFPANYVALDE
ncbi:hypothetical protein B0A48_10832 [Cryoendolithus antarcticus]|uniref:SH3 domain-containing protein n=1 Tax=Cryoendolithus antarcticus TaxID=1507870 RepID=A0A1V8SZ97_9PEZI|nr:hypothetical protein B0A48_10832 [Cryoendolithus antarcticus]